MWPLGVTAQTVMGYLQQKDSSAPVPWRNTDTAPSCAEDDTLLFWTAYGPPVDGEICGVASGIGLEQARIQARAMTGDVSLETGSIIGGLARWRDPALGPMQACVDAAGAQVACDKVIGLGTGEVFEILGPDPTYTSLLRIDAAGAISGPAVTSTLLFGASAGLPCPSSGPSQFLTPVGMNVRTAEDEAKMPLPTARTTLAMSAQAATAVPAGQTVVLTVRKNKVDTASTLTLTNASGLTVVSNTTQVSFAVGDVMNLSLTCAGGSTTLPLIKVGLTWR